MAADAAGPSNPLLLPHSEVIAGTNTTDNRYTKYRYRASLRSCDSDDMEFFLVKLFANRVPSF